MNDAPCNRDFDEVYDKFNEYLSLKNKARNIIFFNWEIKIENSCKKRTNPKILLKEDYLVLWQT